MRTRRRDFAEAPIGYFTIGIQGRILQANARGAELLRLALPAAMRRRITEFMSRENAAMFLGNLAHLYRVKSSVNFDCEVRRTDGKLFWAEFVMNLSADISGAAHVCRLTMTDVTERKRSQEDNARLVAIVASSDLAIISQDIDGTIRTWNAGAERLFGYSASEAVGHNIQLIVPRKKEEEEEEVIRRSIRRGESVGVETTRWRRGGYEVPVFISAAPIKGPHGKVAGVSSIMRDISEQVASRSEVARLLDDLRHADRRKDDFIATLAHELRNPLAPIRNAAAVMRFLPELGPKLKWCRDVIDRQVAHMAALLDDLLDVSRLTRDRITLHRDRVELGAALEQAVELNRHMIDSRGHKLTLHLEPHPIEVEGDRTRLIQVFGNLLNNAAKYTEPGGEIRVLMTTADDEVVVRVSDTGIGIRDENLASIFDLFGQVNADAEGPSGGLGIGLALVKGLVERHGGSIVAKSEGLGRGTEFIVCLPLARPVQVEYTGDHVVASPVQSHERILDVLVVDDNVDAAESLALVLRADHHAVRTAHDGVVALRLAAEQTPDVMVLDLGMPGMSGHEVARRVREEPWGNKPVLIACTGWGQPGDRRRSEESGFDHHLVKPVSASALLRLVRGIEIGEAH